MSFQAVVVIMNLLCRESLRIMSSQVLVMSLLFRESFVEMNIVQEESNQLFREKLSMIMKELPRINHLLIREVLFHTLDTLITEIMMILTQKEAL